MGVDLIMKSSLVRKTLDNITVLFVAFENFESFINKRLKDIEGYKKENLKTEETKLSRKISEGKDNSIYSALRVETENVINSDRIFNKISRNKDIDNKDNIKNKGNRTRINIKSIETDLYKKEISSGFDVMPCLENNFGSPKRNKIVIDKIKNEKKNRLPPVLYTENNFR